MRLRAAEGLAGRGRFAGGVIFISLADVRLPALLPAAPLDALGLEPDGRTDPQVQILQYLAPRDYLLVLDSVEHLRDRADLLVDILTAAPGVRLLVTSRLPLGLRAEQRLPLEGLDYPAPDDALSESRTEARAIADAESVQLFVQMARRVDPKFFLSTANGEDVLRICRLVGGMPLAAVRVLHSDYYLGLVATSEPTLHGAHPCAAVDALLPHLGGVQQAWSWTVEQGQPSTLAAALEGMVRFWELTCEFGAAEALLALAVTSLERRLEAERATGATLRRLLVSHALFLERINRYDEAVKVAEDALRRATREDDLEGEAMAQSVLGEVLLHHREFSRAAALLGESCAYFAAHDVPR